ncbi:hypothetical protein FIBSPDRAFT_899780 [Athelia psychrophila]|uniref:MI domain-containing protein n=1 Tax=Athelia psychrophila TaxID=1759441 RepID=A0A165Z913_9AGAM|nr:hypothetical protein FIBSPDRAFT_899780 [Fibularhizoctonia sp. CBS 109695]
MASAYPGILWGLSKVRNGFYRPQRAVPHVCLLQGSAVTFGSIDGDSAPISSSPATLKMTSPFVQWLCNTCTPVATVKVAVRKLCRGSGSSAPPPPVGSTLFPSARPSNLPPQQLQYPPQVQQQQPPPPSQLGAQSYTPFVPDRSYSQSGQNNGSCPPNSPSFRRQPQFNGAGGRPPGGPNGPGGGQMNPGQSSPRLSHQHSQHPGQPPNMPLSSSSNSRCPFQGGQATIVLPAAVVHARHPHSTAAAHAPAIHYSIHIRPPARKANPACPCLREILRCQYSPARPRSLPRLPTSLRTPTTAASATSPRLPALYALYSCVPEQQHPGTNSANRLSTYANTFVPGPPRPSKISIKAADGSEVDLKAISSKRASPGLPPSSPSASGFNRAANGHRTGKSQSIRMESGEARRKRVAEEEAKDTERAVKEAEENVEKDAENAEERVQREEEALVAAIKKAAEDEEERIRKDEEEKERIRKEAEEAERVEAEDINTAGPSQEARKPRPGPLDLSYGKTPITPGLSSALATARIIEDIKKMEYPEGIMSPKLELNVNAKDGKFKYDRDFLRQFMSICKEKPDQHPPLDAIGREPLDQFSMSRGGSGRHRTTSMQMGPPGPRAGSIGSIGLGIDHYVGEQVRDREGRPDAHPGHSPRLREGNRRGGMVRDVRPTMTSRTTRASPSKVKRQGLGLIKFIGEWFKLQMLTERLMHECVKKLLGHVENPEEEEIESLCKLLSTVGALLDTPKARAHMDVYFSRMKELTRSGNVTSCMRFMLQDVVELRDRKWNTRNVVAAPTTLAAVHDLANEDRAAAERESAQHMNSMSHTGSRRGGPDGWTVTDESGGRGTPRPPPKAGDLSNFGKINKAAPVTFGPTSVFAKGKEGAKGPRTEPISRSSSSSNMFSMLSQNSEIAADASGPKPTTSRSASRKTSIDLGTAGVPEAPLQRKNLQLLPQSKMTEDGGDGTAASTPVSENGEVEESGTAADSMSETDAKKHLDQDWKEFFAVRNLDEAEEYFQKLTPEHRFRLADKLVNTAIESKAADAPLVSDFFAQAHSKDLCSEASFEEGFMPIAELLDGIAIDTPRAFDLMAVMVKGASLSEDARGRIAAKSVDSEKLLALLST